MNICFLLGGFQSNGGIGRVTSILANTLCEKEDITVHTLSYCQTKRPLLYALSDKIKQHALFCAPTPMLKAMLLKQAVKKVQNILVEEKIDVLIAAGALFYPLAIQAVRGTNARCYCWEHTNPACTSDHKFQGWCRKYAVKRTDKMVVLTHSAEDYYRNVLHIAPDKLLQIYNPIVNSKTDTPYDTASKKIIAVGRLSYPKNFDRLIRLAKEFLADHSDWTVDIYGKGEQHEALQKQIDDSGLTESVRLMGQVNDLYSRYSNYAFQIMTSRYEGFPMSLLEGATHRLPLVAFDIPTGPNEIITDGENGFLVDASDDDRMVSCIKQLMDNVSLRTSMSDKAYEMVQSFSLDDIINQWCNIL